VESLPDLLGGNVPDLLGAPVLVESVLPNVPDLPSVVCCALLLCRLLRAAASRITVRVLVGQAIVLSFVGVAFGRLPVLLLQVG